MNKLFTKIASLTLGLALAAGAGAFLGSRAAEGVSAVENAYKTITFGSDAGTTTGSSGYGSATEDKTWTYECDNLELSITNFNNNSWNSNWTYIKAGSSKYASTASIATTSTLDTAVTKVSINIGAITSSYITSITLYSGASQGAKTNTLGTYTKSIGVKSITIASPTSGLYYTIEVVCTQSKSNGPLQLNGITFYHDVSDVYPETISCDSQNINVLSTVDLSDAVQLSSTAGTVTVKNLAFELTSGADNIDLDTSTGVVTGKKSGNATVAITADSDSSGGTISCTATINVSSIAPSGLTIGDQYALYAVDTTNSYSGELSSVSKVSSNYLGIASQFTGDTPSCDYLLTVEEGYYENTVSFNLNDVYLSYSGTGNELKTEESVSKTSSWKVEWDSTTNAAVILNAANLARSLQFNYNNGNTPRFACYTSVQTAVSLYHYVEHALVDFTIDSEVSVYKTGTATIGVTYDPADAADKTLSWSSDDTSIATVDSNGVVTGVAVGTTTITATKVIDEFNVERTCTVTVLNNVSAHRGTYEDPFNVADAVQVANGIFVEDPDGTEIDLTNEYYVCGWITKCDSRTPTQLTFWIGDNSSQISAATGGFEVFKAAKVYGEALGTRYDSEDKVKADFVVEDYVKVKSTLTVHNGIPETTQNVADIVYSSRIEAGSYSAEVVAFAEDLLGYTCDASGETAPSVEEWGNFATFYAGDTLSADDKTALIGAPAVEHETPVTNDEKVEAAMAKYDYIVGKYNKTLGQEEKYPDFINRNPAALKNISAPTIGSNSTNTAIIVVSVIAIVSVSSIGVLLVLKRRKNHI